MFVFAKNNLARDIGGLAFEVEGATVGEAIKTSRVAWREGVVTLTADDVLGARRDDGEAASARDEAEDFLPR